MKQSVIFSLFNVNINLIDDLFFFSVFIPKYVNGSYYQHKWLAIAQLE